MMFIGNYFYIMFILFIIFINAQQYAAQKNKEIIIPKTTYTSVEPKIYRYKRQFKPNIFTAPKFTLATAKNTIAQNVASKITTKQRVDILIPIKKQSSPYNNATLNIQNKFLNACNKTAVSSNKNVNTNLNFSNCNSSTLIEKRKVVNYSEAILKMFDNTKYKSNVCGSATCELFPPADFKYYRKTRANSSEGLLITKCGAKNKHLFLSKEKDTQQNHWKYCCSLGMIPAVIQSKEELNCIQDIYTNNLIDVNFPSTAKFLLGFTDHTMKRDFVSCPDKLPLPDQIWAMNQPDNMNGSQHCSAVTFNLNKNMSGVEDVNFNETFNMFCQSFGKKRNVKGYAMYLQIYQKSVKFKNSICDIFSCDLFPSAEYKLPSQNGSITTGLLTTNCSTTGKHMFISQEKLYGVDLFKYCCSQGMTAGIIESREEMNCLFDFFTSKNADEFYKKSLFVGYFDHTMKREFYSCPDTIPLPEELWAPSQPDNKGGVQTMIVVDFNGPKEIIGFNDVSSSADKYHPICQYEIKKSTTIKPKIAAKPYSSYLIDGYKKLNYVTSSCDTKKKLCAAMNSTYKFAGLTKVNESEGLLITSCLSHKHYFLSTARNIMPHGVYKYCCNIGMTPAAIQSKSELHCIYDQLKSISDKYFMKPHSFSVAYYDDTFNHKYINCFDKFDILPDDMFAFDAPDNRDADEVCIKLKIAGSKSSIGYDDRIFTTKERSIPPYSKDKILRRKYEDICMTNRKCKKTVPFNLETLRKQKGKEAILHTGCGNKLFYLAKDKETSLRIWNHCCELGLIPATIQSREELNCIYKVFKSASSKENSVSMNIITASITWNKDFVLSYMDSTLNYSYTSCPDKQEVDINLWTPNEPNNNKGIENCVSVSFDNKRNLVGFYDVACDLQLQVMCQSPRDINITALKIDS